MLNFVEGQLARSASQSEQCAAGGNKIERV
jgi:hypothetical protein